ncbi:SDR family NAD(P)-dependent oxidoreductase [Paenibacillus methanolicus]|uniref:Dihydroanticapsin dehydrogenase n=1 Tax=Paenibacillus methanolicus TaxID=582686 RepID=A0A5S5CH33_9BACL|nr:SDR family oxidoreductase [Paenibacillus methanolicus]TYP79096.1 dihydroanticapsin dehydrogenase [Paenibacillus methanolicus]
MLFKDHVVIVTGAGSGIGESCARRFASEGACVVIAELRETEGEQAADRINRQFGGRSGGVPAALFVRCDVSHEAEIARLMERTLLTFGRLDVLVNNAAVIMPHPIERIDEEGLDLVLDVNVKGAFLLIKHAAEPLKRSKGSIVNIASLGGLTGQKNNPAYTASKGAVIALTKSLALDFAQGGVRVNCVCPAGVRTPLLEAWTARQDDPARTARELGEMHPLGRLAEPDEIASAVLFLAGRQASFITGAALPVDGGASLGY